MWDLAANFAETVMWSFYTFVSDYEEHRPIRKITGPTYSQANVNEFVPELRQNIERLLDCIDRDGQK